MNLEEDISIDEELFRMKIIDRAVENYSEAISKRLRAEAMLRDMRDGIVGVNADKVTQLIQESFDLVAECVPERIKEVYKERQKQMFAIVH